MMDSEAMKKKIGESGNSHKRKIKLLKNSVFVVEEETK